MATEKEVKLEYKSVEIRVLVTETCNEIRIQFFNPGNEDFVEDIKGIQNGWRFQDKKLQKDYEELIEKAREIDEKCYKDARDGEVFKFKEDKNL
jgi:hypothetical protein